MVAGELALFSYRAEKSLSVQVHFFDDSVLDEFGSYDFCAKGFGDSLVAKTYSQNGNFSCKIFYRLFADASVTRSSRAWRHDQIIWLFGLDVCHSHRVVSDNLNLVGSKRLQGLDNIVCERIVIVDYKYHYFSSVLNVAMSAPSFSLVSSNSRSGTLS